MAAAVMKPPPEWPQMPTRLISIYGCMAASSSAAAFLVGETVVAQIAVAESVVPLVALRAAAAIADFDDDEAELRESDVLIFAG